MSLNYDLLTDRQTFVLHTINDYWRTHFRSPSIQDLCLVTGIRTANGVHGHIRALRKKGFLSPVKTGSARGYITPQVQEALEKM
tara:strand:+ start:3124 stop:3375 length:252 start_codon:yes stop_codon:yes gene_type:complete